MTLSAATSCSTPQPRRRSTCPMMSTSRMAGTQVSSVRPSANSDAAISFRAEFFAPPTVTSPARRAPPDITRRSTDDHPMGCGRTPTGRNCGLTQPRVSDSPRLPGMAIHLTRIYTRTGDDGSTALGDMSRVHKTDPRLVAYADVDEANSAIGVAIALGNLDDDLGTVLRRVQNDLFDVGADLAT